MCLGDLKKNESADGFCKGQAVSGFLLTKNKDRNTIIKKNVKPEGSVPPWKVKRISVQNAVEKQPTP